ncbi:MAG TPA: OmpH family outer membrane protein [Bryobacteraceae bacterium]|nr:OmpH family outer membrane protein [Bryobacteraceae bacterium]
MKTNLLVLSAFVLGAAPFVHAQTPAPTKVGIIHVQNAILSTKDGQKAQSDLATRFNPKKAELEKKQANIAALQDQLRKGNATMSDDAKNSLVRQIDADTKSLNRENEDAQADLEQAESKIYQDLGQKMMAVIDKYAKEKGFAVILDVSNQQTPVLWASNSVDITTDIVRLYDEANPSAGAAPAAKPPAAAPAATTPRPTPPRPSTSAPKK